MDYCSFQPNESLLDIQMPYDSQSYSKTISFPTINQGDICMILGYMFLRKLSFVQCVCVWLCLNCMENMSAKKRRKKKRKKKQINWINKVIFFVSWIIKIMQTMSNFEEMWHKDLLKRKYFPFRQSDLFKLKKYYDFFFPMKDLKHLN